MKKSLQFLLALFLTILLYGCKENIEVRDDFFSEVNVSEDNSKISTIKEVTYTEGIYISERLKRCPLVFNGLSFKYPSEWGGCKIDSHDVLFAEEKLWIETTHKSKPLWFVIEVRELTKEEIGRYGYEEYFNGAEGKDLEEDNFKIYNLAGGGGIGSKAVILKNKNYLFRFYAIGDEKFDEDISRPEHNFRNENLVNIIKNIEVVAPDNVQSCLYKTKGL